VKTLDAAFRNRILNGDCLEVLKTMPDACMDSVVTDPPYGIGNREPTGEDIAHYLKGERLDTGGDFMGKEWEIPPVAVWQECYRILKPGGHLLAFAGCYDEHTEVLTRKGWVRFPDVTGDEEFASLDPETHKVGWQRAKEVVRQPNPGEMVRYKTNKVDLLVTPNHNMFVATLGSPAKFSLVRADEHGRAIKMTKTSRGRMDLQNPDSFKLPAVMQTTSHGHQVELPEKVIPLDAWLPFFGLYLAEGSASIVKNKPRDGHEQGFGYNVSIAHFDTENLREVQRRLSDWFDVKVYESIGKLRINDKQLTLYLRQFGKSWEKFIPDWIKTLPSSRLKVLWDWYMRGDGHDHRVGYTTSSRLRDDWQEVAMYMGISADWVVTKPKKRVPKINGREIHARRPSYAVTFNHVQNQPEVYDRSGLKNPVRTLVPAEEWQGRTVYCVELERHHTLYVRRNGKAVWCGNTRTWDIMSIGIRAAGFENRDTVATMFGPSVLQWVHGQGFPKSLNIGKAIAKLEIAEGLSEDEVERRRAEIAELAKKWDGWGTALKPAWEPVLCFRKPVEESSIAEQVVTTGTGGLNIDGTRIKHANAADLEAHKAMVAALKAKGGKLGNSWKNSSDLSGANDVKEGGRWPANVVMVHAAGCEKVGTKKVPAPVINRFDDGMKPFGGGARHPFTSTQTGDTEGNEEVAVFECVEGCPVKAMDEQSGRVDGRGPYVQPRATSDAAGASWSKGEHLPFHYGDSGGASRFFGQFVPEAPFYYSAKASRSERNSAFEKPKPPKTKSKNQPKLVYFKIKEGVDTDVTMRIQETVTEVLGSFDPETESLEATIFERIIPESLREHFEVDDMAGGNDHPTVKPIALMSFLVRLVTPKDGIVLDPYCGSGTTCAAATEAGLSFVGIEKDEHFHDIASKRVLTKHAQAEAERSQKDLFDEMADLPE
jgi:DNA modification methylase